MGKVFSIQNWVSGGCRQTIRKKTSFPSFQRIIAIQNLFITIDFMIFHHFLLCFTFCTSTDLLVVGRFLDVETCFFITFVFFPRYILLFSGFTSFFPFFTSSTFVFFSFAVLLYTLLFTLIILDYIYYCFPFFLLTTFFSFDVFSLTDFFSLMASFYFYILLGFSSSYLFSYFFYFISSFLFFPLPFLLFVFYFFSVFLTSSVPFTFDSNLWVLFIFLRALTPNFSIIFSLCSSIIFLYALTLSS